MPRTVVLLLLLTATVVSCGVPDEPMPPVYTNIVALNDEPWLSANAEIVDVDGDGKNDVVLAIGRHWPGTNLLLHGDGMGGFTAVDTFAVAPDRSYSNSAVDMDGDGDIDLVVSNDRPDGNYVLFNDGSGTFGGRYDFGDADWPTRNSTIADVNLDGKPDILVANRDNSPSGNNVVCLNETETEFTLNCMAIASGSATTIAVADMNADGRPDLIIPYRDLGQSHIYLGDGTGKFDEHIPFGPADASFRAAIAIDLNSDGLLDVVAINDRARKTTGYLQLPGLEFGPEFRIDDGEMIPYALDQADLDGNDRDDILVGYRDAPSRVFFNYPDSLHSVAIGDSLGAAYGFGVGDLNHDGILDIAVARSGATDLLFLGKRQP